MAKMNIYSALTKGYENALLRSTKKTNPISIALPNAGCIAKDARRRTKKCQTKPISEGQKTNISLALTKNYENARICSTEKTKPISSAPTRLPAVKPSKDNSLNLKSEICDLKSRLRLTPGHRIQTPPYSLLLTPFFVVNFQTFYTFRKLIRAQFHPFF